MGMTYGHGSKPYIIHYHTIFGGFIHIHKSKLFWSSPGYQGLVPYPPFEDGHDELMLTEYVVTRYYRAPEVVLTASKYTYART